MDSWTDFEGVTQQVPDRPVLDETAWAAEPGALDQVFGPTTEGPEEPGPDAVSRARDALVELDAARSALGGLMTTLGQVRGELGPGLAPVPPDVVLHDRNETWFRQQASRLRWEAEETLARATNDAADLRRRAERQASRQIEDAERRAQQIIFDAEQAAERVLEEADAELEARMAQVRKEVDRLGRLETQLRDGLTAVAEWILESLQQRGDVEFRKS